MKDKPWFVTEAIEFLEQIIQPDWAILEAGSGGSTIWFAGKAKSVVSFEHNKAWHKKVEAGLEEKGFENVDLRFDSSYPRSGISGFQDEEFDFISVDGRGRVNSIKTAADFLKPGGYLLLDNSEREQYSKAFVKLDSWKRWDFGDDNWRTSVWKKP